ncbi:xanthine dehydrogenase family protein molybdopterin-binding subunit [Antarcticimicrobium luteum]|uniref:Xanthine dehydrogenase family protein molybdopterin-binding subunit n=1 Tax=Antarcticimicrobium luteum TaxID=2547397 RepID=A0A4R5VFM1_9RHOB|nr:xanthine dehydrogenase family protein molybdopterin-binding subunit [Antarcticimicrobium luteum]TDK51403.1 xanthine dehydrogenase family protein molybdopterin-binding subunit [Antarcticimicrobium luteum]
MRNPKEKFVGSPLARREDPALISGRGTYTDDVRLTDPLHLAVVRSMVSAGTIDAIETEMAADLPGVAGVHTGADLTGLGALQVNPVIPIRHLPDYPVLAGKQVHSVGQPIAAILAGDLELARDACEQVRVEIDDAPLPDPRLAAEQTWSAGDVTGAFEHAERIVECEVRHPRLAPSPMEPRSIAVAFDAATETVTVWLSTQTPHRSRNDIAAILGLPRARIRLISPDVGGAFGMKSSVYPEEVFAVWAAFHHRRDIRWTSTRSEEFLSATHGRAVTSRGRLALDREGRFLALSAEVATPVGHWLPTSGLITAWNAGRVLPSGYRLDTLTVTTQAWMHNTGLTGIYRGAGRPEANCLMERLIDKAAAETGIDPFELRRRNLLRPEDLPFETPTGNTLDSGDYAAALDLLEAQVDYAALCDDRDRRRAAGELVGIGIGFYVEPSGSGWETARATLNADGSASVQSGSSSQGHGRATAFAQIAADALGIEPGRIEVTFGDTATCPEGIGALASRSTPIGGSAVLLACEKLAARQRAGDPLPITEEIRYANKGQAWGYGAFLIVLSVDRDTGAPTLERAVCVDDTGLIINPMMVEGQLTGGFAQALGEALMERVVYDENGQLLTGSFMDYAVPRCSDVPPLTLLKTTTPSPMNALGAKGVGEAGTIGAPAAILNAAIDALRPLGVSDLNLPLTSETLWRAIRAAEEEKTS